MTLQKDQVIEQLLEHNAELQQAVIDMNEWVVAGEGVDCLYYHDLYCKGEDQRSVEVVTKIMKNRW